jgi:uncharacterized protein
VEELFAPPGAAWTPVSPDLARMRRTAFLAVDVLLLLLAVVAAWLLHALWLTAVAVGVLAVGGFAGWVLIGRNARRWGYAERDEELFIRHGALFRRLVVVPYGRMQYVDVHAGPVEQLFGLAGVHLHTASPGTSARIPGLRTDEAARLRDRLTSLGEAQAAGL